MALIVTAEDASHLPATRKSTGYGGPAIVDPEHVLLEELKRRGWLDVAVSPRAGYEKGMAQPGVLVVRRDGSVVYEWAIRPSLVRVFFSSFALPWSDVCFSGSVLMVDEQMNLGGAKDRPNLEQAFDNAEAAMSGGVGPHKVISKQTFLQGIRHKIFG